MRKALARATAAAGVMALGALGALALPASASARPLVTTAVVTQYPAVSASTIMLFRPDGGGNGYWATDFFVREAQVGAQTAVASSNCGGVSPCYQIDGATLTDVDGTFATIRHAYTPNQGSPFTGEHIHGTVQGSMSGSGEFGTFYATALPSASRVPEYNFGTAHPSSTWPELFFPPGTQFTGLSENVYSYTYVAHLADGERWVDSSSNGDGQQLHDGNITG